MESSKQDLKDTLELNIRSILPHLSEEKVHNLVDFLISKGVKREIDLRRMTVPVLEDHLKDFIDASDLHDEWQKCYGSSNVPEPPKQAGERASSSAGLAKTPLAQLNPNARQSAGSSQLPSTSSGSGQGRIPLALKLPQDKMPKFDRSSPYMPSAVRKAIDEKVRPSAAARAQMVDRIVDHCREVVPNLERSMFNQVALSLVISYPESFKDTVSVSDHGSDSLAKQFRTKFDNDKRPEILTPKEKEAPSFKQAYGCLHWNPSLPEESCEDSQEDSREALKGVHTLSRKEWEWKLIKKYMDESYFLQRKEINGALAAAKPTKNKKRKRNEAEDENVDDPQLNKVSIPDLKERWPFLFTCRGMNYHFINLTGIDFRSKLFDFVQEDSAIFIEFLAGKGPDLAKMKLDMVRAERNGISAKLPTLLQMLIKALKDDFTFFVRYVESTTLFEEVQASVNLPSTPVIIAAGSSLYESKKFFLCIEGAPIATEATLLESFSMLFSAYFVLNIEYPNELSGLLNFSQRIIAKIAPQKGSKSKSAAADKLAKDRVVKLNNKYVEFKQQIDNIEN